VDEAACNKTETARLRTKGGRLPDVDAIARAITDAGVGGRLRGVEATIDGWLVQEGTALHLRLADKSATLRLAPLTGKVQWDVKQKRHETPTKEEALAHAELERQWKGQPLKVRIVGPLVREKDARLPVLQVRQFVIEASKKDSQKP
jgi:hypothetical protein